MSMRTNFSSLRFGPKNSSGRALLRRGTMLTGGCLGFALGLTGYMQQAHAFNLYSGQYLGNDLEINFSTTVEYSNFFRVNDPSAVFTNNVNGDEGDRDFRHGLVSNEFSVLPVLDMKFGNAGLHVSGQTYLNTSYLEKNQNNSPGTFNPISTSDNRDFTSATRNINGEEAQFLDAYGYDSINFGADGQQTLTAKVGRQTLLWGQSLFFSNNGIAAGQAPINIITAESLPNAQTAQIIAPVGQAVLTYQPDQTYTIQGYYQFEWEHDTFQGVGSYFSSADILDKGGQRLLLAPGFGILRTKDLSPPAQNGQFGLSVQAQYGNYDIGLYGLRYDSKTPVLSVNLDPVLIKLGIPDPINYNLIYPRDIQIYGASVSTNLGPANVAAEVSGRRNMPLFTTGVTNTGTGNASSNPLYPVGNTIAAQTSFIYVSPGIPLDPGGVSYAGEFAMNHLLSVDENKSNIYMGRDNTAGAFDISATPTYYSVFPNLNLEFPVSVRYNLFGRSAIDGSMNHGTGTLDVGVTAIYATTWTGSLTYQDYLGKPDTVINSLADRGYVTFNVQHTF